MHTKLIDILYYNPAETVNYVDSPENGKDNISSSLIIINYNS